MAKKKKSKLLKSPRKVVKKKTTKKRGGSKKVKLKKSKPVIVKKKVVPKKPAPEKKKEGAGFSSNNFNHIRSLLWKEHKADFKGYFDPEFIRKVNSVYNDCKADGVDCTDQIILKHYSAVREDDRRPFPEIPQDLYENEHIYYEITNVNFKEFPSYLWIVSPSIISPPSEFIAPNYYYNYTRLVIEVNANTQKFIDEVLNNKGGFRNLSENGEKEFLELAKTKEKWTRLKKEKFIELYAKWQGEFDRGYYKYFSEWVNWCNDSTREGFGGDYDSEDVEIFYKFTKPEYDEVKKRWFTILFSCTASGEEFTFGYVPQGKSFDHEVSEEYVHPPSEAELKIQVEKQQKLEEFKSALEKLRFKLREFPMMKEIELKNKLIELELKKKAQALKKKIQKEKERKQLQNLKKKILLQKAKEKELKRLIILKREQEKTVRLHRKNKDRKRLKKALIDLDKIVKKINRLI